MRGRRNVSCERSGAWACSSASASSGVMGSWRRLWKRAYWSASDSGRIRLAMAAYLIAVTSVSGVRPLLSSATTRRPSRARPRTWMRSRRSPAAVGRPSISKVMILTAGPRMAGLDSTHSCRSARSSNPASSSEIICAGIATEPATVKSISSAMGSLNIRQTIVKSQVSKVTDTRNGTPKNVGARPGVLLFRCDSRRVPRASTTDGL